MRQVDLAKQLGRMMWELPGFLRSPLRLEQARAVVRERMLTRETRFLATARTLLFGRPASVYGRLLENAGCTYADLEASVRNQGLEGALGELRDNGVFVTLAELKGLEPIRRDGLEVATRATDFDNPLLMGRGIESRTSGLHTRGARVVVDWSLMDEHAANELLLHHDHGVAGAPLALWLPALPAISGIQNLLINVKLRRPPERWYSQLDPMAASPFFRNVLAQLYTHGCCRLLGQPVPWPELTGLTAAERVVDWLVATRKTAGAALLRTFTSSAVRVAKAARARDISLADCVAMVGGEPLTAARAEYIESTGMRVVPRYASTEVGYIGGGCPHRTLADDMHIYQDRVAAIAQSAPAPSPVEGPVGGSPGSAAKPLLFTTLSPHASKILLNADIGDVGELGHTPCDCVFGRLGMSARVSRVRSYDKLTGEGVTLLGSELDATVGDLVRQAGGGPDDYQFQETRDPDGLPRLQVAIDPEVDLDAERFRASLLERMARQGKGARVASQVWSQAGTVEIIRARPRANARHKLWPLWPLPPGSSSGRASEADR